MRTGWAPAVLLVAACGTASAADETINQQAERIKAPQALAKHGPDLFGDTVNLYTGSVSFLQTDVSLKGNSALQVAVSRRFVPATSLLDKKGRFGRWELEIPRMHGIFSADPEYNQTAVSCAHFTNTSRAASPASVANNWTYWTGKSMYIPGQGDLELLQRDPANQAAPGPVAEYPLVTSSSWQVRCLNNLADTAPEGFLAISPSGVKYRFDHFTTYSQDLLRREAGIRDRYTHMQEVWILPSVVTDRYGNWVRYAYDPVKRTKLISISASDGRRLSFEYTDAANPDFITAVSDGTLTWQYTYTDHVLDRVILPDGSYWQLRGMDALSGVFAPGTRMDCEGGVTPVGSPRVGHMVHPSGAGSAFTVAPTVHGRSNVPETCLDIHNFTDNDEILVPKYFQTLSLRSKAIFGPGISDMEWKYGFPEQPAGSLVTCTNCPTTKNVDVTDPEGVVTRHTFGNQFGTTEGRIEQVDQGWNGSSAARTTRTFYRARGAGPYPERAGLVYVAGDSLQRSLFTPVERVEITQDGSRFVWTATQFDVNFPRPTAVTKQTNQASPRKETTVYSDNFTKWIIGQIGSIKVQLGPDGTVQTTRGQLVLNSYNATTATLSSTQRFGGFKTTFTYNADGTLKTQTDAALQTTTYSNYVSGLPKNTQYHDLSKVSADITTNGDVLSTTDEMNAVTRYEYQNGRLRTITQPVDTVNWYPTVMNFWQIWNEEREIGPGHWRQDVATGDARTVTYYDALWRPVITETWDAYNEAGTKSVVRRRFDSNGQTVFTSYPKRSAELTKDDGVYQYYDALGRLTVSKASSELGLLTTTNEYLSGFIKRTTDPRNAQTATTFQTFDQPVEGAIATITAPEGVYVSIVRNELGIPQTVTRSGLGKSVTRNYVYDVAQRVCKTKDPETGATFIVYDRVGNVSWRASGVVSPSPTSCDNSVVTAAQKIGYTYDARNRLLKTTYGDASPEIERTYYANGLLKTINSGGANWTYSYNTRGLPLNEDLVYAGATYSIGRSYNRYGSLDTLTYPDKATIDYAPNSLGEPTKVGSYASGIAYHPSGAIERFVYGNGIARSLELNERGLPKRATDAGVLDDLYAYDQSGNVKSIQDLKQNVTTRTMGYDDLGRLLNVSAPALWGEAVYTYDALDNITTSKLTNGTGIARNMVHQYDATNRLYAITGTAGFAVNVFYDALGNVKQRGTQLYSFDLGNRLRSADGKGTYLYDGHGRRMSVVGTDGVNQISLYSQSGQLLYTTPSTGGGTKYIYLHNHQIAQVKP